jgi:small subunit ribosomal protein S5
MEKTQTSISQSSFRSSSPLSFPFSKLRLSKRRSRFRYSEKILEVTRVTKVVKGGKILSFRAAVILGNQKGKVALGIGKADNVNLAIEKALLHGKKHFLSVPLTKHYSLPHSSTAAYGAAKVFLQPRGIGTGVIAGGAVRPVLELAGIKNVSAKQFGSKNLLNNAKATLLGLSLITQKVEIGEYQSGKTFRFYQALMRAAKEKETRKIRQKVMKLRDFRKKKQMSRKTQQKEWKAASFLRKKKKGKPPSSPSQNFSRQDSGS